MSMTMTTTMMTPITMMMMIMVMVSSHSFRLQHALATRKIFTCKGSERILSSTSVPYPRRPSLAADDAGDGRFGVCGDGGGCGVAGFVGMVLAVVLEVAAVMVLFLCGTNCAVGWWWVLGGGRVFVVLMCYFLSVANAAEDKARAPSARPSRNRASKPN